MNRSILFFLICGVAVGCRYYDDEGDDESGEDGETCDCEGHPGLKGHGGPAASGGRTSTGGAASGGNPTETGCGGATASGGTGNDGSGGAGNDGSGGTEPPEPLPPCAREADCAPGSNCDVARGVCTPSDAETCGELTTEAACDERTDCLPVYAGVDCSCGPDCQCVGGEPGCICASFEFFRCEPVGDSPR